MQAGQWGSVMSADTATGASPSHRWVQAGLVIVTAAELLDALFSVQSDYHLETDLLRFAQRLTTIKLALSPLLAGAALVFAALGNIRYAIFALAALTLTGWALDSLPSIVIHGFKPSFDFGGMEEFFLYLVAPIVTIAAVFARPVPAGERMIDAQRFICHPHRSSFIFHCCNVPTIVPYWPFHHRPWPVCRKAYQEARKNR